MVAALKTALISLCLAAAVILVIGLGAASLALGMHAIEDRHFERARVRSLVAEQVLDYIDDAQAIFHSRFGHYAKTFEELGASGLIAGDLLSSHAAGYRFSISSCDSGGYSVYGNPEISSGGNFGVAHSSGCASGYFTEPSRYTDPPALPFPSRLSTLTR